jgi:hypothetical protein
MYLHRPETTWSMRVVASARTLVAILLTAILAWAVTARWSDASATGSAVVMAPVGTLASGVPVAVEGTVVGASDGVIALVERGAESPVAFPVAEEATVVRGSERVPLDALRAGDTVRLTIDGLSGTVLQLHAVPVAAPAFQVPGAAALLAALGLIAGATALAILNIERLPKVSTRFATTRLLPAAATR